MKTIYKYKLDLGYNRVVMPDGADILTVHEQNGHVCLWALVDTSNFERPYRFMVIGTGGHVDLTDMYLGTAHVNGLVWHVFEEGQ